MFFELALFMGAIGLLLFFEIDRESKITRRERQDLQKEIDRLKYVIDDLSVKIDYWKERIILYGKERENDPHI